jgi:glycosyltransferase involved in cell wall biosynthesis
MGSPSSPAWNNVKIAYLNSICKQYDAISNAIREEIGWLRAAGHEVRLFAYACEFDDVPCTLVNGELDIVLDPFFQQCDMAVFHFGVYYPLFNLLMAVPRRAKRIVVFHNVTPKRFLPPPSHALIDKSFSQMANIAFADHVVCDSAINQGVLRAAGINVPSTVLSLAVDTELSAPQRKPSFDDGVPRVLFVGRLVQSKAPLDLLAAVQQLLAADRGLHLRLDLVANLSFSDAEVVGAVRQQLGLLGRQFGGRVEAQLHGNASEALKQQLLSDADLFVLPTHHEGFCVPILESFATGCRVICYDNSNTPAVSGGLATLVPTGDVQALAAAVQHSLHTVQSPAWHTAGGYQHAARQAEEHLKNFSVPTVRSKYLAFIKQQGGYWT